MFLELFIYFYKVQLYTNFCAFYTEDAVDVSKSSVQYVQRLVSVYPFFVVFSIERG